MRVLNLNGPTCEHGLIFQKIFNSSSSNLYIYTLLNKYNDTLLNKFQMKMKTATHFAVRCCLNFSSLRENVKTCYFVYMIDMKSLNIYTLGDGKIRIFYLLGRKIKHFLFDKKLLDKVLVISYIHILLQGNSQFRIVFCESLISD